MHIISRNLPGRKDRQLHHSMRRNWDLYLLIVPVVVYFAIFHYAPMYGVQIAFRKYSAGLGITGSRWVGLDNFRRFFNSYYCVRLIRNTLLTSLYDLAVGFPIPIILALIMNEVGPRFKKAAQTITYAPHFLSTVVLVSMLNAFLRTDIGLVNKVITGMGGEAIYFTGEPGWFRTIYVLSGVWQHMGWSSIIYISALSGIDTALYEAGRVDGATRWQMMTRITLPSLLPTITIMLIMNAGQVMSVGFEKVFLMQNDLNISTSDVISTYVYRSGMINAEFSFSAAVGLFNSGINCILLFVVNAIARRIGETSLW